MLHKRFIPSTIVILALAAPGAVMAMPGSELTGAGDDGASATPAQSQDLRSPDARDAAGAASVEPTAAQDLRSPDARDAASGNVAVEPTAAQDLRSPDARDAASGNVQATQSVPPVQTVTRDDGFEWSSAGIGAAAMLAIVLAIAAAAALIVPRRRQRSPMPH